MSGSSIHEERAREGVPRAAATGPTAKRVFDVVGAVVLLTLTAPLFLVCAALVRLGSSGRVLFGHRRFGRDGKEFSCLKFRTMVEGAEAWLRDDAGLRDAHRSNGYKLPDEADPRVTGVGRILRRSHLDELPQLVNVLRGEMSLVGPRPIVEDELALYGGRAEKLLSVRPGIFGAWTALGADRPNYPERCEVELAYVGRSSLLTDAAVLARNLVVVLRGQ